MAKTEESICRLCGSVIYRISFTTPKWSTGPVKLINSVNWKDLAPNEPWFTTCPGSKEALARFPVYTDYFTLEDRRNAPVVTRHEPVSALERLVREAQHDETL